MRNKPQQAPPKKQIKQPLKKINKESEQPMFVLQEEFQLDPAQEPIISLIQEYLLRYNLNESLRTLQQELVNGAMGGNSNLDGELLESFDAGEADQFFVIWNRFLPYNLRMRNEDAKKLEFYIQIYFLIYEIHPKTGRKNGLISKNSVNIFKAYLDTKGQELSKTNEFLPYYALPYVQRPQEHQTYKHLFTNQWILEIKGKLVKLLNELLNREQMTVLEQMYQDTTEGPIKKENMSQSNQNYTTQLEINNQELVAVIQDYNIKYNQMQRKFKDFMDKSNQTMIEAQQKWYQVNKDVTDIANQLNRMLEESRKGEQIQQEVLDQLLKKLAKLSKFFSTSVEEIISQSQDISMYERASIFENDLSISPIPQHHQQQQQQQQQQVFNFSQQVQFVQLNYPKIQQFFLDPQSEPDLICKVLQALRFRITTVKAARVRREILIQYAQFDILGCTPRNIAILQRLLIDSQNSVKEYTLRLTNAMASDYEGRSYLMDSLILIKILIDILKKDHTDSLIRRNALGALQKLSLRRKPQIVMIDNDVVKWIVTTLEIEKETLSEYSYEYATALFMNLSMREQGKKKCVEFKKEVLKVLNDLLEHENVQVRTFVNGTLYSLFSIQSMREQAQELGMKERLMLLMQSSDERFTKQIQYILEQINKKGPDEVEADEDNDIDDIDDIDESDDTIEDEDAEDGLKPKEGELVGEDLLSVLFALNHQEAAQQNTMTKSMLQDNHSRKQTSSTPRSHQPQPFRPTTPNMQASQLQKSNLPTEMQAKPLIARTPVDQYRKVQPESPQMEEPIEEIQPIKPAIEARNEPKPQYEQQEEYVKAFSHKPKIPRTPPGKQS